MKKNTTFIIAILFLIITICGIILGNVILKSSWVQDKQYRSSFKKIMERYNMPVKDIEYNLVEYYHENSFTEQRYYFAVDFANDYPELLDLSDGLSDKMDETTVLEVNGAERILKEMDADSPMIRRPGATLKSKIIYLEGSNKRRYLIVIYDPAADLFHFINVLL